ncbi:MAG: hypothetical protein CO113_04620 [Elusimicrobia bacterium CG_4_9_14_3_um_filter_62_55]|nr:MAG: hypothetical protein COR54_08080 [Elusimicrobia bacterium CG22_combo_CG10-13_8_21_14_all_63_91]PJA11568.1 MAG: hypothetical protein COX66_19525 [Elusimicrobia bacterium CG_4_10_14_0_2_um_filter_63_34]PJB26244.1 MAG: hypothetical protein CO113_04620 [Elusimicrobia bacterium CG_4_9_14_3_um_filter_62_55]
MIRGPKPHILRIVALVGLFAASACSIRTLAVRTTADAVSHGIPAFYEESDPVLARQAMPGQLKLLEVLLRNDPKNAQLLAALTEGYAGYAFLFLEDAQPDRAAGLYKRASEFGMRLLSPDADFDAWLDRTGTKDLPGLYWTASALAGWANLDLSNPDALAAVPNAEKMMTRVLVLDASFQYGGADAFFGVLNSARPVIAGGDPVKGRNHFLRALAYSDGAFLPTKLLYMKYYATAALDEALFRRLHHEIAEADSGALPQMRLANEVAKLKAARLMEQIDDLF